MADKRTQEPKWTKEQVNATSSEVKEPVPKAEDRSEEKRKAFWKSVREAEGEG